MRHAPGKFAPEACVARRQRLYSGAKPTRRVTEDIRCRPRKSPARTCARPRKNTKTGANGAPTTRSAPSITPAPKTSSPPPGWSRKARSSRSRSISTIPGRRAPRANIRAMGRTNPIHTMLRTGTDAYSGVLDKRGIRAADDMVTMPLQCGTQWDGLGHVFYENSMWNGYDCREVTSRRRAEVRHREDQEQDGRPRRAARRRALQGRRVARRRLRHHQRRSVRARRSSRTSRSSAATMSSCAPA